MESAKQNGRVRNDNGKHIVENGTLGKGNQKSKSNYPRKLSRKSSSIQVQCSVPTNRHDFLHWDGWGYKDSGFTIKEGVITFTGKRYEISGKELPYLKDYIKEKYDIILQDEYIIDRSLPISNIYPESKFSKKTISGIQDLGIEVSVDGVMRYMRSRGQAYDEVWRFKQKLIMQIPDAVAWPTCHEEVVELVKLANEENFVIIPFGGGTSVARALMCPANEARPILSLDTNKMNEILWVDLTNLTVCAEGGIIGQDLERELNKIGYTTGHEPDSNEFSTLGGWVSTRASGMKKNLYGNIEDLLIHARMVTPNGVVEKGTFAPRMSCGPDFNHVILGSEGSFGVITEVVIKIRPFPQYQTFESIVFPNFEVGVKFMREVALRRWQPASIRLMDEEQFQIGWALRPKSSYITSLIEALKFKYLELFKGFDFNKLSMCTICHEGNKDEVNDRIYKLMKLAEEMGGVRSGATVGKRGYMMTYVVAYMRDIAFDFDVVAESLETAMPWDTVYEASVKVREAVISEGKKMGVSRTLCMMRIAQTYDAGCCLYVYFSFAAKPGDDYVAMCDQMNARIKETCLSYGGSLSHHHGIGKLKMKWYQKFISDPAVEALKGVKQKLDPNNVFGARNFIDNYYDSENHS